MLTFTGGVALVVVAVFMTPVLLDWFDDAVPVEDLRAGDCVVGSEEELSIYQSKVDRVRCDDPSEDVVEVLFSMGLVGDQFPGDRTFLVQRCGALGGTAYSPSPASWDDGDRHLLCIGRR